jgi:hypothetical protein
MDRDAFDLLAQVPIEVANEGVQHLPLVFLGVVYAPLLYRRRLWTGALLDKVTKTRQKRIAQGGVSGEPPPPTILGRA